MPGPQQSTPSLLPSPGDTVDDRYRILYQLGEGARGIVFQAEQLHTSRQLALKFLHPHVAHNHKYLARFQREVQIATRFNHPAIIRVYDVGQTSDGLHYLVMELLDGQDLQQLLQSEGPLPSDRIFSIGAQLLDGLAEAHAQNILHRDIKPANIFISRGRQNQDRVKLLDFGIARLIDPNVTRLTASGTITGTPAYMPPETFVLEDAPGQPGADVYGAGLVLLEMTLGQRVVPRCRLDQLIAFHLATPITLPASIASTPFGQLIQKATMKHPDDRFAHAEEMLQAFHIATQTTPAFHLTPDQLPPPPQISEHHIFDRLARATTLDEKLQVLREQPQHTSFPPPPANTYTPSPSSPHLGHPSLLTNSPAPPKTTTATPSSHSHRNRRLLLYFLISLTLLFLTITGLLLTYLLLQ